MDFNWILVAFLFGVVWANHVTRFEPSFSRYRLCVDQGTQKQDEAIKLGDADDIAAFTTQPAFQPVLDVLHASK
jgi:hypothetical protein